MTIAGTSENYGVEQEHLNNVFGARLRITALRAARGPGVELLEYLAHEPRLANIRVAIVSASPELAPEGYRVFAKPLDLPSLLEFLRPRRAA